MPVVQAAQEGLLGLSMTPEAAALRQFGGDEFGGFTLYQGSPHNFSAERLVRMPDGSTQYVVGRPDVLPDVPQGATVVRDYPLGRARMDKIGTGEGAQAFGHGIYGAEAERVATGYRDALTDPDAVPLQFMDRPVNTPWNNEIRERWPDVFTGLSKDDGDAMEELLGNLSQVNNLADVNNVLGGVSARAKALYYRKVKPQLVKPDLGAGSMYEMNVDADPNDFLDWDKPLSQQPQKVRDLMGAPVRPSYEEQQSLLARLQAQGVPPEQIAQHPEYLAAERQIDAATAMDLQFPSGNDIYMRQSLRKYAVQDASGTWGPGAGSYEQSLAAAGGDPKRVRTISSGSAPDRSEALREAGIPGIRYLDAGSRSTGGTSNFVIFDENLIDIVRKYGIAGAAAMLGASQADVAQAMQQQRPQGLLSGPQ
jgi:hypothetical protein